jgi:hypothetical protein
MLLAQGLDSPRKQRFAAQQQHDALCIAQDLLMQSGSSSSSRDVLSPQLLVQLLEVLAQAAVANRKWQQSPLARWACDTLAAAGLDSLAPQQLLAAAAAVAELQPPQAGAAAAALAAVAVSRADECGAGVMVGVLWACVTVGCNDMLLADVTVGLLMQQATSAPDFAAGDAFGITAWKQQQPQQQQPSGEELGLRVHDEATAVAVQGAALTAQQQGQLVWSLQVLGRTDLLQQVLPVYMVAA